MLRSGFFLSVLLACVNIAAAQNVVFTATGATKMGDKDAMNVTFTIKGTNPQSLTPNFGNDFRVVGGPSTSSSTSIVFNGNQTVQTRSISYTYVVQPKHTGNLTIPPAVAKDAAGHTYQSNPLSVQVVPGSLAAQQRRQQASPFGDDDDDFAAAVRQMQQQQQAMMQRMFGGNPAQRGRQQQQQMQEPPEVNEKDIDKDLFIRVTVDKQKVHLGEQITTSYKLYSRIPMNAAISKLPSLNGFWTQDFDIPRQPKPTIETLDGKKYQVFLLKKSALFPQQTGTLELDPAEAEGVARIVQRVKERNPFADDPAFGSLMMNDPVFNNAFFSHLAYKDVKVHLKSVPVKITVTPLPEKGKPADYGGAVGNFTIAAKMAKTDLTTDDATNLTLTITGSGNLKLIEAPKLNLPNGLDSYDPQIVDTITGRSTTISGSKIITYAITPHTPGDYTIPSLPFSYFNPQTGAYTSLQTEPIKIHVTAGKHYNSPVAGTNAPLGDIHGISSAPLNAVALSSKPLLLTPDYWSMYVLPLFAFIGVLVWKRREEELSKDTVLLRSRRANKIALKRLTTAQKLLQQNSRTPFYEEVSKAIWLYLSDKLNIPLSSLSRETAEAALSAGRITSDQQRRLNDVIMECETALYAQTGGTKEMQHTYNEAVKIISELEDTFKA